MTPFHRRILYLVIACLLGAGRAQADGYDRIAGKITVAAKSLKRRRVAVLQFPYIDNRLGAGPRAVQELLMTKLVDQPGIQVVERAALGQMVEEITLSYRGLLDPRASYQLGQILDVDAVLTGTLVELPNRQIQINARLIRLPDGLILAAVESLVKRTWKDPSSLPAAPSLGEWLGNIFSPVSSDFHQEDDINKFVQEQLESLNSAASAPSPRAVPVPNSPSFALLPDSSSPEGTSKRMITGRWVYEQSCTYCHGPQGKGSQAMAEVFGLSAIHLDLNLKSLERYSAEGLTSRLKSGKSRMPAYQKPLTEEDAASLLEYLRHLTASLNCSGARARVDQLERDILELKAQYWALELRKSGTSISGAPKDMTSALIEPEIKNRFYERLKSWSALPRIPAMTPAEVKRFVSLDSQAYTLRENCGL